MTQSTKWMVVALAAQGCNLELPERVEEVAAEGARVYRYVPPNPRDADGATGDMEMAVVFVALDGFGPHEVDPQDLRVVLGNSSQGGIQSSQPPPFIQVAPYFEDVSNGQLRIHPTVFNTPVQLSTSPVDYCGRGSTHIELGDCDIGDLERDILDASAQQLGLNLDAYDSFLIVLDGLNTPGIGTSALNHGGVQRRVAMIRDNQEELGYDAQPAAFTLKSLVLHELMHSLGGLWHAAHWYCYPDVVGPDVHDPEDGCHDVGNQDPLSPIGSYGVRGLSAYHRSIWGLFERHQTYWAFAWKGHFQEVVVEALESTSDGTKEIRIPFDDNDHDAFYSVEYRRPIGVDAAPLTANEAHRFVNLEEGDVLDGLVVRLRADSISDAQPGQTGANRGETALLYQLVTPEEPFYDPYNHVSLSMTRTKGDRAIVDVGVNVLFFDAAITSR